MKSLLHNKSGMAYGYIMFMVLLIVGIFAWMIVGLVMDSSEEIFNSDSLRSMYSDTIGDAVEDISNSYSYVPFFIVVAGVVFLFVRGLKRDETEQYR